MRSCRREGYSATNRPLRPVAIEGEHSGSHANVLNGAVQSEITRIKE